MKLIKPDDFIALQKNVTGSQCLSPDQSVILLVGTKEGAVCYTRHKYKTDVKYAGNEDLLKTVNKKSVISILTTDNSEYSIMVADGNGLDSHTVNYLLFQPKKENEVIPCVAILLYGKPGRAKVHCKLISSKGMSYSQKFNSIDYMCMPRSSCEYILIKWGLKIPWNKFEDRWFGSFKYKEDYYG